MPKPQKRTSTAVRPEEVRLIQAEITKALNTKDATGTAVGNAKYGVYAFFDYDGEPIYVGQTAEKMRVRILRHLTNQRTDAVAMSVLDPFEVAEIAMWPFWNLQGQSKSPGVKQTLNSAEYTLFQRVLKDSAFNRVLNEVAVAPAPLIDLPNSVRASIIPKEIFDRRKNADIRIARRAATIARLAHIISERAVQPGIRNTLLTQARRLEHLASLRLDEAGGPPMPGSVGETTEGENG